MGRALLNLTKTIKPRAPRIVAFGDEFFGPSSIHPFNAMIRNGDVPYRVNIDDFKCESAQPSDRPALIGYTFDTNGLLKKFTAGGHEVLAAFSTPPSGVQTFTRSIKTLRRWNNLDNVKDNLVRMLSVDHKSKL